MKHYHTCGCGFSKAWILDFLMENKVRIKKKKIIADNPKQCKKFESYIYKSVKNKDRMLYYRIEIIVKTNTTKTSLELPLILRVVLVLM